MDEAVRVVGKSTVMVYSRVLSLSVGRPVTNIPRAQEPNSSTLCKYDARLQMPPFSDDSHPPRDAIDNSRPRLADQSLA